MSTDHQEATSEHGDDLGEAHYYEILDQIFQSSTWRWEGDHDRVLEILQKRPSLASRRFGACRNRDISPLTCLLLSSHSASSTLETIQAVYNLYPDAAVELQGIQKETALHAACRYTKDDGSEESFDTVLSVVEFIYHANPAAVFAQDKYGKTPLKTLLQQLISLDGDLLQSPPPQQTFGVLKRLLALNPTIVSHKPKGRWSLLQCAAGFWEALDATVLDYIVEAHLRQNNDIIDRLWIRARHSETNGDYMKLLCTRILPNVRHWELGELSHPFREESTQSLLLENLAGSRVIQRLDCSLRPRRDFELLERMLATIKTLVSVTLGLSSENDDHTNTNGYGGTEVLRILMDSTAHPGSALKEVELVSFRFPIPLLPPISTGALPMASKLRKLCLTDCYISCEHLLTIPSLFLYLEELSVKRPNFIDSKPLRRADITAPVISIVDGSSQMRHLKCLNISGSFALKTELVCDALQHNTFLKELTLQGAFSQEKKQKHLITVLREKNTTLEEVGSLSFGMKAEQTEQYKQLQYLLRLNKWGRRIARDAGASREALGKALCKVCQATNEQLSEEDKFNTLFGLLREVPSLWVDN